VTIITAADWRFALGAKCLRNAARSLGYNFEAYDLGELGFGRRHVIANERFVKEGNYCDMNGRWKSKALHKPDVILSHLLIDDGPFAYLDADAILLDRIDEAFTDKLIGVTVRRAGERCEAIGKINAGVMFFNPHSYQLVKHWKRLSDACQNDQKAINALFSKQPNDFAALPTEIYNNYYFDETTESAKILHFKDDKEKMVKHIVDDRPINLRSAGGKHPSPSP